MRKRIAGLVRTTGQSQSGQVWLELDQIATVEVTSENPDFPIESVFNSTGPGWRASQAGEQQIRIIFDAPLTVHRIQLRFEEQELERTQEFTVRWSSAEGGASKEIVRQQWNFSPAGATSEVEDYDVTLEDVAALELNITPDITRRGPMASLAMWRVA